jgi:cytoskeletal protein CcmA (bactofilin family)
VLRGTGTRGNARQSMEVTLVAKGTGMDALKMALHAAGQIRVNSGARLTVLNAPVSTNGDLRNDGVIDGDIECRSVTNAGTFTGSINPIAPVKPMPSSNLVSFYKNLGTTLTVPTTIENVAIGPGYTPWGPTNADGLYVINNSSDIIIRNCRVVGTLVITGGGKRVTIEQSVSMQPYRDDYPVIVTDSDVIIQTSATALSEASQSTNFNPPGVPWNPSGPPSQGATNVSLSDTYPCIIQGLVHTRATLRLDQSAYIKGMVLVESGSGTEAVGVYGTAARVEYDKALFTKPPMGYTKSVTMSIVPGSWKQVVY